MVPANLFLLPAEDPAVICGFHHGKSRRVRLPQRNDRTISRSRGARPGNPIGLIFPRLGFWNERVHRRASRGCALNTDLWVSNPLNLERLVERFTAPASAGRIWILNLEPLPVKAVIEIDGAATQISETCRIQKHGNTFALQLSIVGLRLVERHAVLKTGAAA